MASFNDPKVTNSIVSDVNALRALIRSLATMNPASGNTDMPEGSIQFIPTSEGVQFRQYNGSAWSAITSKLMHDVDKVDGYDASKTSIAENIIPVYKTGGLIAGGCEGNAGTASKLKNAVNIDIGGYISGTAVQFDGSKNITLNVNRIDVNNELDNVLNGIISKAHGGTGRDDGAASDIVLPNGGKASDYGQVGDSKTVADTNLDTLTVPGNYFSINGTTALSYPHSFSESVNIIVSGYGIYRKQTIFSENEIWIRDSKDSGSSWGGWKLLSSDCNNSYYIYISKSGSDTNTGLDQDYPVLTIDRALSIAKNRVPYNSAQRIVFCIGEGDWGDVSFVSLPFNLFITNYSDDASSYSESLPKFTSITFHNSYGFVRNIVVDHIISERGSSVYIDKYIRFSRLTSQYLSLIYVSSSVAEIKSIDSQTSVFYTNQKGQIVSNTTSYKIVENLNLSIAFAAMYNTGFIYFNNATFTLNSGVSVTGKKYMVTAGGHALTSKSYLDTLPGSVAGTINVGGIVGGIPYGGGASDEALMADMSWKKVLLQTGGEITGKLIITGDDDLLKLKDNRYSVDDTSIDSDIYSNLYFLDKNNQFAGVVQCAKGVTGNSSISLIIRSKSTNNNAAISLQQDANGNSIAYCPTPPDSANSTEIVTAAWANKNIGSKLAGYLPLSGGNLTGMLQFDSKWAIDNTSDGISNGFLVWRPTDTGAYLWLMDSASISFPGGFAICARSSAGTDKQLVGIPNGQLTWNGAHIVRSVNGAGADANGNVNVTSVANTGFWPAYHLAMVDSYNFNFYIRTPAWGTTWFVVGYAEVQAASYRWANTFFSFAGANTDVVNITADGGVTWPNPRWVAQNICCFRMS